MEKDNLSVTRIRNEGKEWVDAFNTFANETGENVKVENADGIDTSKTWEEIEWDDVKADIAKQMLKDEVPIDSEKIDGYEDASSDQWDKFYKKFQESFFKNRSYLGKEFPELSGINSFEAIKNNQTFHFSGKDINTPVVLEIGCGVGNSLIPLMELNPDKYFIGFDCSKTAVELFQKREDFNKEKCHLFVLDPITEEINSQVPNNSIDVAILIFVLSAIAPKHMDRVLKQIFDSLKPGGILLLRDYGQYDMTQMRFYAKKNPNKMAENYYRREDGTFTYFFEKETTNKLFGSVGFLCEDTKYDTRVLYNRKRMLKMYRVWIRGRFRKPTTGSVEKTE